MLRCTLFCLFSTVALLVAGQDRESLVNTKVERALDLISHLPKETIKVTFENRGSKPARHYDYCVEPQHVNDVAYVGAVVSRFSWKRPLRKTTDRLHRSKAKAATIK